MKNNLVILMILLFGFWTGCSSTETEKPMEDTSIIATMVEAEEAEPEPMEVRLAQAEILLENRNFIEAKPILLGLLEENPQDKKVLHLTAICLGGWLEERGGMFVEEPGTGDYCPDPTLKMDDISHETALGIWNSLLAGIESNGRKYSQEWWEAKFQTIYTRYRAGEVFPDQLHMAKAISNKMQLFQPFMGGPDWKPRFKYMEKAIEQKVKAQK
jgi:hypothetical protein